MLLALLPSDPLSLLIWLIVICVVLYVVFNLLPAAGWPTAGATGRNWGFPAGNLLYLLIVVVVIIVVLHLLFSLL